MKKIVILASGSGSNAENVIRHFQNDPSVNVAAVLTNNPEAGVIEKAERHLIEVIRFSKSDLENGSVLATLKSISPDLVVLSGFLLRLPASIVSAFPDKIINIHPALLPAYGGQGMYGMHVHRAIVNNREVETGISIHYVDEHYDEGGIILQEKIPLDGTETAEQVAEKVRSLEHEFFPKIIQKLLQ